MIRTDAKRLPTVILVVFILSLAVTAYAAETIKGQVLIGRAPVAKSEVTVWEASSSAPRKLGETKSNEDGRFEVRAGSVHSDSVIYITANGGQAKASKSGGDNSAVALLTLLTGDAKEDIVINELTTVASAFTNARFINAGSISGNPLGLRIAAGNVPNLVDPPTGAWGKVLLDPLNSTQTSTLASLDTLSSLITA